MKAQIIFQVIILLIIIPITSFGGKIAQSIRPRLKSTSPPPKIPIPDPPQPLPEDPRYPAKQCVNAPQENYPVVCSISKYIYSTFEEASKPTLDQFGNCVVTCSLDVHLTCVGDYNPPPGLKECPGIQHIATCARVTTIKTEKYKQAFNFEASMCDPNNTDRQIEASIACSEIGQNLKQFWGLFFPSVNTYRCPSSQYGTAVCCPADSYGEITSN